jgi:hypothetical protein
VTGFLPAGRAVLVEPDCTAAVLARAIERAADLGRAEDVTGWPLPTWDAMVERIVACYGELLRASQAGAWPQGAQRLPK